MKQVFKVFVALVAFATLFVTNGFGHGTHYGKVVLTTTGNGRVYLSTNQNTPTGGEWSDYTNGSSVNKTWNCGANANNDTKTFYPFAEAEEGYVFRKFEGNGYSANNNYIRLTATSTTQGSPTTTEVKAYFKPIATPETPVDYTDEIVNPGFEDGLTGWTNNGFESYDNGGQFKDAKIAQLWSPDIVSGSISQNVANLPAGDYELKAKCVGGTEGEQNLYVQIGEQKITTSVPFVDGDVAAYYTVKFTLTEPSNVTIGFERINCRWWTAIDDVTLVNKYASSPSVNAELKVSAEAGWGTFIAPFECEIPEGVEAYTVEEINNGILTLSEPVAKFAANTPYIVSATADIDKTYSGTSEATEESYTANYLTGSLVVAEVPVDSYVLQRNNVNDNYVTGFYLVSASGVKVGKNKCYLTIPSTVDARVAFFFSQEDSDIATAVSSIEATNGLADGKYIIGGKIVVVKNGVKYNLNGTK